MRTTTRAIGMLALSLAVLAGRAEADLIIDQQNTGRDSMSNAAQVTPSFGQSFTPTLASLNFVTVALAANSAATYRVDIYAGEGFGGPVIGSSLASAVPISGTADTSVEFDFATLVALTPGSLFTFRLVRETGSNTRFNGGESFGNQYAGGAYISSSSGTPSQGTDLTFSEGINTALTATPEPSTIALAACGVPALLFVGYRRRRRQTAA